MYLQDLMLSLIFNHCIEHLTNPSNCNSVQQTIHLSSPFSPSISLFPCVRQTFLSNVTIAGCGLHTLPLPLLPLVSFSLSSKPCTLPYSTIKRRARIRTMKPIPPIYRLIQSTPSHSALFSIYYFHRLSASPLSLSHPNLNHLYRKTLIQPPHHNDRTPQRSQGRLLYRGSEKP